MYPIETVGCMAYWSDTTNYCRSKTWFLFIKMWHCWQPCNMCLLLHRSSQCLCLNNFAQKKNSCTYYWIFGHNLEANIHWKEVYNLKEGKKNRGVASQWITSTNEVNVSLEELFLDLGNKLSTRFFFILFCEIWNWLNSEFHFISSQCLEFYQEII